MARDHRYFVSFTYTVNGKMKIQNSEVELSDRIVDIQDIADLEDRAERQMVDDADDGVTVLYWRRFEGRDD
jgi:hypothetical protein